MILLVVLIFSTSCLGAEIALSNTQTDGYSAGSLGFDALYLGAVFVLPIAIAWKGLRSRDWNRSRALTVAALVSLLIQLLFLPFAIIGFAM